MIRLNLTGADRIVHVGGGVTLTCAPVTSAVFTAARKDPRVAEAEEAGVSTEALTLETVKAIARRVIKGWDGVGDAEGNAIEPDADSIDLLIDIWPIYEDFNAKVCGPALMLVAEGNAPAPLRNGTSVGAPNTVTGAPSLAPIAPLN